MSTTSHVCLGTPYRNSGARSSGKIVNSRANPRHSRFPHLLLAEEIARAVGIVRTWANLSTIHCALESEAEFSNTSTTQASALIVHAATERTLLSDLACPSEWEIRENVRMNSVDRFWFEDARWRMKRSYWQLRDQLESAA